MAFDVLPWLEYRWDFGAPAGMFRPLLERLRGTPLRLDALVRGIRADALVRHEPGKWSALEHAGHLCTVEALWQTRIAEFLRGEPTLSAADMTNRATNARDYNRRSPEAVLDGFRSARAATMASLDPLTLDDAARVAHHPRLGHAMRLLDLCTFAAEHDDHHLALIRRLAV
ncbi:MAG TPA: DinB family protein [Thermoanaerobaculaceae bacterium]|nr:DinB family protein [Thermoanaerobaculaceae bacterium]